MTVSTVGSFVKAKKFLLAFTFLLVGIFTSGEAVALNNFIVQVDSIESVSESDYFAIRDVPAPDGFEIEFTKPVNRELAGNPALYNVTSFTYMYRYDYGSPIIRQENSPLKGLRISDGGKRVRLVVDNMREKYIHEIKLGNIRSEWGIPLLHDVGYYTLNYVPENDNVLYHTAILQPGSSETIYFTTPETPGIYTYVCTFPGHHIIMRGTLVVRYFSTLFID